MITKDFGYIKSISAILDSNQILGSREADIESSAGPIFF